MRELLPADQHFGVPHAMDVAMHAQFMAGAALSLLAWWLESGTPLTPRQMAQYLLAPHGTPSSH
jgi:hypothetical protein